MAGIALGVWLGAQGYIDGALWWIVGNEGLEYLEVGRLWQVGLLAGFVFWTALVARGFKLLLDREERYGLAHMIIFFVVAIVGVVLVSMNLLSWRSTEKAVMFSALFVMGAGVIGVSHHYWWVGLPEYWVPLGSVFSTLEFIPLIFILFEALGEYRAMMGAGEDFPYRLPFMFIIASGLWNFVGGGVLGFFINLPLVNYYEHGTFLTVGHAHGAMFGAFGLLALGLTVYALQFTTRPGKWDPTNLKRAFWLLNAGLAWMVFVGDIPVGFLQLETAFTQGYDAARSLAFYNENVIQVLFWARLPGDILVILGAGVFCYDVLKKRFVRREATTPTSDGTIISRRVFGEEDEVGTELDDD